MVLFGEGSSREAESGADRCGTAVASPKIDTNGNGRSSVGNENPNGEFGGKTYRAIAKDGKTYKTDR